MGISPRAEGMTCNCPLVAAASAPLLPLLAHKHCAQALDLAEGKIQGDIGGRWHIHHRPHSTFGEDAAEKRALAIAENGKLGDVGGRWQIHHHPHVIAGSDKAEEKALALASGEMRSDIGGRWVVHQHPHSTSGNDEHEKRALLLAEGKMTYHPQPHPHAATAPNSLTEDSALKLAEGKEGAHARQAIAAGHATAIAKHDEGPVTIESKWGPLSAARNWHTARQQQLRAIEEQRRNMHFDKSVSPREVSALLRRAAHMTGMHEKKQSPLVQLSQVQELNAIENKEAKVQRSMELSGMPAHSLSPLGSTNEKHWSHATRGRRDRAQSARESMALKLAEEPSAPVGMTQVKHARTRARAAGVQRHKGGKDYYHQAAFEEEAIREKKASLAKKQAELKRILAVKHEAAKAHQALRGMDVLAHGAQRALDDDMVSPNAVRRGFFGL